MKLKTNPRGNGACPLCTKNYDCSIKNNIGKTIDGMPPKEEGFEIVIYLCPMFKEIE